MLLYILALLVVTSQARGVNKIAATDVTTILNTIASKDVNGGGESDVVVSFQNQASHKIFDHDNAPQPLFTSVNSRISSGATFKAFETLQKLYTISDTATADPNTQPRIDAANAFLDAVMATDVMKTAQDFLAKAGLSSADAATFKKQLFDMWFATYSRGKAEGSSGFEGAFIGETSAGEVTGLNYWYRFYLLEQAGKVNYHGWFTREKGVQLELQFSWNEDHDMMDSFLLGTSPEFDMAAYTICALANVGDCKYVKSGNGVDLTVKTTKTSGGALAIDSVYPSMNGAAPVTEPSPGDKTTKAPIPSGKLQETIDAMWAADDDKPTDFKLNWGNPRSGTKDTSPEPLMTYYNEDLFQKPQYKALNAMYDANVFSPDVCTAEAAMSGFKKQYVSAVFDAFTNTTVFAHALKYLQDAGKAGDWASFRPKLWTLWMGLYSRCSGTMGSSGFEHVFSGEWKGSTVDGQHCWVKYYRHEKAGEINYNGYVSYDEQLTGTFQYTWLKYLKKTGGFNTGTSPGFDFSVFSICALAHGNGANCKFNIMGYPIVVVSYTQACTDGTCLSTSYPTD